MLMIMIEVLLLSILCEGVGFFTLKWMKIEPHGFTGPIGFAVLLAVLQLVYYPAQLAGLPFTYIAVATSIVLVCALAALILCYKEVFRDLFRWDTLIVAVCVFLFLYALNRNGVSGSYADAQIDLNMICQNIGISRLNFFDPVSGAAGQEGAAKYLFLGYCHFASYFCWISSLLLNSTASALLPAATIAVCGMGMLYSILSSMLIVNMVRYFHCRNHWYESTLLLFSLLFTNSFYWKVAFAFTGSTWQGFFITMMLFAVYRWQKEKNEQLKYLLLFISASAIASSRSSLFLVLEILYMLSAFLFQRRRIRSLFDLLTFLIPSVLAVCAYLSRINAAWAWVLFLAYTLLGFIRYKKPVRRIIARTEEFFFDHAVLIFFLIIPAAFAAGSLAWHLWKQDPLTEYSRYFTDFGNSDMVKDYLFIHSGWLDNILNLLRWTGVVMLVWRSKQEEDRFVRSVVILLAVFFLNPLCMILLEKTAAGAAFYRAFEILFNPFTEILFFTQIYQVFAWTPIGQWVLEIILAGASGISLFGILSGRGL